MMPAKKYLNVIGGRTKQVASVVVSAGAGNDGDIPALDAAGKLDISVLPSGVGQNTVSATATEALAAGDLVNLFATGARKADATTEGKEAHGFVKASVASAAAATIYLSGNVLTGLTGLTVGDRQYLATTAGARTTTAPSASGNVVQMIGIAASATSIIFEPEEPITVA
jgi:hypothetical protein